MKKSDAVRRHNLRMGRSAAVPGRVREVSEDCCSVFDPFSTTTISPIEDKTRFLMMPHEILDSTAPLKDA